MNTAGPCRTGAVKSLARIPACLGYLLVAVLMLACSSQPADRRSQGKQAADVRLQQGSQRMDGIAYRQIDGALAYYEKVDDRAGQWRASDRLANWYIARGEKDKAEGHARRALRLAEDLDDPSMIFTSSVQLGQIEERPFHYRRARRNAQTTLQLAIATALLGDYAEVERLLGSIDPDQNPDGLAFVYYRYGKYRGDRSYVLAALGKYRQADNVYGVIDSLFLAARLSEDDAVADDFAERALLAAERAGNPRRVEAIREWLRMRAGSR